MTEDCAKPADKHPVLVLVAGYVIPFVSWCKTWSDGAFWIIPGGTPETNVANGPFIVTHWCDCLPATESYLELVKAANTFVPISWEQDSHARARSKVIQDLNKVASSSILYNL